MRPDPDSDQAGLESEYGDDTGFAAEATRTAAGDTGGMRPADDPSAEPGDPDDPDDSAGLTAEDDPGRGGD